MVAHALFVTLGLFLCRTRLQFRNGIMTVLRQVLWVLFLKVLSLTKKIVMHDIIGLVLVLADINIKLKAINPVRTLKLM